MATLDLDDGEKAALAALLRAEIENTRYPLALRTRALRSILDKLEPAPLRPQPYQASKPPAQPSHLLAKKRRRLATPQKRWPGERRVGSSPGQVDHVERSRAVMRGDTPLTLVNGGGSREPRKSSRRYLSAA
jgi:hypothetical protein